MNLRIQPMDPRDWESVRAIYLEGIATGNATFETAAPEWAKWDAAHRSDCRLVAREGSAVVGWAALSPVSSRKVYEGVAEVSVYVAASARSKGVGKLLLRSLIEESERRGVWTLQAGVFPENVPSIRLHEEFGFRRVGVRERVGKMGDRWRDVVLLERRSRTAGIP
jgi:L-amino acid N-acyltransferase YncA